MATTTPLLRLPPELILRISNHLTTAELGYCRRACKQIEHNLFNSFAREFFTKRQFMIEEPSLETLVGIANHKSLAPFLQGQSSFICLRQQCSTDIAQKSSLALMPFLRIIRLPGVQITSLETCC